MHNPTAVSGSDFGSLSVILRFDSCAKEVCENIRILNDNTMELLVEELTVSLEEFMTDPRVNISAQPSSVQIIDDDGLCV